MGEVTRDPEQAAVAARGATDDGSVDLRFGMARAHLALLFPAPVGFVELRSKSCASGRWLQRFLPATNLDAVARAGLDLCVDHEVYVGVLPRDRRGGARDDLRSAAATVWADLDSAEASRRAAAFIPPPSLLLRSGGPGHAHAYWALDRELPVEQLEALNAALAERLGADGASVDGPRILRLAGTVAHKYEPSVVVAPFDQAARPGPASPGAADHCGVDCRAPGGGSEPHVRASDLFHLLDLNLPPLSAPAPRDPSLGLAQAPVIAGVPSTVLRGGVAPGPAGGGDASQRLEAVPPASYVRALTGLEVDAHGKVRCPLHRDHTPSLHVYATAGEGWFCFGCRRGGSIYDLAAALWKRPVRGRGFLDLRDDLLELLFPDARRL
jgi:hypothetical protein